MKKVLLAACFLSLASWVSAQALKVTPAEVKQTFRVNLTDPALSLEAYAAIENTGADTLRLRWLRKELDKPSEWLTQVCDGVECFVPIVSSNVDPILGLNTPLILPPRAKFSFIFYVLPNQVAGTGKYDLTFAAVNKPDSVLATMHFDITVQNLVTNTKDWQLNSIQVFPNPATDYFTLNASDGVDKIVLYSVLGVPIKTFLAGPNQQYSLRGLPDGMYLVSLVNNKKGNIRTVRLSKRSARS